MHRVFEGDRRPLPRVLGPIERFLLRASGVDGRAEQTWLGYTASLLVVSFTTNTNWQGYGGESTMSYLSQMAGLAWHNFVSAAAASAWPWRLSAA